MKKKYSKLKEIVVFQKEAFEFCKKSWFINLFASYDYRKFQKHCFEKNEFKVLSLLIFWYKITRIQLWYFRILFYKFQLLKNARNKNAIFPNRHTR